MVFDDSTVTACPSLGSLNQGQMDPWPLPAAVYLEPGVAYNCANIALSHSESARPEDASPLLD
jgi:hypothetical protein